MLNSSMRRPLAWTTAVATLGVLGLAIWQGPAGAQQAQNPPTTESQRQHAESLSAAFRAVAEHGSPSVVALRTRAGGVVREEQDPNTERQQFQQGQRPGRNGRSPFEGTPFEEFFNDPDTFGLPPNMQNPRAIPRRTPVQTGLGSGFIIDESGVIMTNNHVVEGADEVIVELADGREYEAIEWFTDPDTDLAIVKIEKVDGLQAVKFGSSEAMQIGDWVVAVGSPFGLEMTVTAGIVSAKGRGLSSGQGVNFLQTDAAINPGNSGGPLFNLRGEVIGINTAIATETGAFNGIGFAIPSDTAQWVARQLVENGEVRRAYLGVVIQELDAALSQQFNRLPNSGILVAQVMDDSPAGEAGVEAGDIIIKLDGRPVRTPRELQSVVHRLEFGTEHEMVVLRNGDEVKLPVTVRAMPSQLATAGTNGGAGEATEPEAPKSVAGQRYGLEVGELTDALAEQLGYEGRRGVLITSVEANSAAAAEGLEEGMLISQVAGRPVTTVAEFEAAVEQADAERGLLLLVRSSAGSRFLVLRP